MNSAREMLAESRAGIERLRAIKTQIESDLARIDEMRASVAKDLEETTGVLNEMIVATNLFEASITDRLQ